jgi:hypothetical protein
MSSLLVLLILAVAVYAALGALSSRPRSGPTGTVAEFNRALAALDPSRGGRTGGHEAPVRRSPRRTARPVARNASAGPRRSDPAGRRRAA